MRSTQATALANTKYKTELKAEILEEVRSYVAPHTEEVKEGLAVIKDDILKEVRSTQASVIADIKYERLKDKASAKKHNLIVLGLAEEYSSCADRRSVLSFFRDRMGLHNLMVAERYMQVGPIPGRSSFP